MRLTDISLNEDTGGVGHSVGHVSRHHLAAQHAGSLTVVLVPAADQRPQPTPWSTRQELRLAIVVWIERKYHRQRPQDSLDGLTPIEYEHKITTKTAAAA